MRKEIIIDGVDVSKCPDFTIAIMVQYLVDIFAKLPLIVHLSW